ncbi:hypothetical protein EJ02DRAFT_514139 [Clathrospora elynae]|uniref:Uncharacterized protein n=1 Tax=Clathrospora elynae TaxID=706981 RepID=A0A6A5SI05_9PLEO|nr:hypothetical protein EJ02DRAFT_514139 [Clathrospora elynae]
MHARVQDLARAHYDVVSSISDPAGWKHTICQLMYRPTVRATDLSTIKPIGGLIDERATKFTNNYDYNGGSRLYVSMMHGGWYYHATDMQFPLQPKGGLEITELSIEDLYDYIQDTILRPTWSVSSYPRNFFFNTSRVSMGESKYSVILDLCIFNPKKFDYSDQLGRYRLPAFKIHGKERLLSPDVNNVEI